MDNNKTKPGVLPNLCDWCGKPMPLSHQSENLVCPNCFTLLSRAGVSDERIYRKAIYKNNLLPTV